MTLRRLAAVVLILAAAAGVAAAAAPGIPPAPTQWVTDRAGFLSPATVTVLNARLRAFEQLTGDQIIVWVGTTIGDNDLETWAAKTFAAWGIGKKGKDNGLALFILTRDRKIRIEVGYGLEGRVTDLLSSRVIREILVPGISAGRQDEAVVRAVDVLLGAIDPQAARRVEGAAPPASAAPRAAPRKLSPGRLILFAVLGVGFLFLFITNPTLAMYLLFSIMSGGRGGGGLGGGGFSGGGGRSGGGGASGGW